MSTQQYFETPAKWRAWLRANHEKASEIIVGFHKVGSGVPSISWPESVDEALCFGWIDGVRRRVDDARYTIRFTKRKSTSIWSAVNVKRVAELSAEGRMMPSGLTAFAARRESKTAVYSHEQKDAPVVFAPADEQRFRANAAAWAYFETCPAWYRRSATWRVVSAKKEATREKRLLEVIEASAAQRWIGELARR